MKIIGVTGKSGAGKTTFSSAFGERKNVGVIHLDNVMADIKEEKFQDKIRERNKNNHPVLLTNKIRTFLNSHRITFKIFMAIKRKLMEKNVKKAIADFKMDGKDAVIVDGIFLREMINPKLFDSMILVKRPYIRRLESLTARDDITKAEIVERDLPYRRHFAKHEDRLFDYIIDNRYGKDELKAAADKIYDEVVGIKTFDERYAVKGPTPIFKNIVRTVEKTAKANRRAKVRED